MDIRELPQVLIVEDDISISQLEKDLLERERIQVTLVENGEDALSCFQDGLFDLVIIDVMLPGMNGFDVCKKIRETSNVPIVFITSKDKETDIINGYLYGANDYMVKPFDIRMFVVRIKGRLNLYTAMKNTESLTQSDTFMIDDTECCIYMNRMRLDLKKKEYLLLAYFLKHPNMVLSKELLFDEIWGSDSDATFETVTVHVAKLRKIIEKDPRAPEYILTVHGFGYRFVKK